MAGLNSGARKALSHRRAVRVVRNLTPYYAAADAFVMNSQGLGENFGRVTIEAMTFKLPVLGTNAGGTPEIVEHARAKNVGLRIFPCVNPSGFTDGTRYNRSGEHPNNDFLRYEIAPGTWVGELTAGQAFLRMAVHAHGPKETRALRQRLEALAPPNAALDIHQDPWMNGDFAYAYTFGPRDAFRGLWDTTEDLVPVARDLEIVEAVRLLDPDLAGRRAGLQVELAHDRHDRIRRAGAAIAVGQIEDAAFDVAAERLVQH